MFQPGGFRALPPVTKNLLLINALIFVAGIFGGGLGAWMQSHLPLFYPGTQFFQPYQFITYMFVHGGFFHILFNMFALYMFGAVVEQYWGPKRFFGYYFLCGVGAALIHYAVMGLQVGGMNLLDPETKFALSQTRLLGASGAIYGLLIAFGLMFPNNVLMLMFPPIPLKAKWFVLILVGFDFFMGIRGGGGVAHFAHLGGGFVGLIALLYWRSRGKLMG